jgi:nicotinamide-nucleotide amidase
MEFQAELISIGNELLSGRTLNTHAKDLGRALTAIGLKLVRDTTIPDQIEIIGREAAAALSRTNLVFVSGGLGPTVDDMTRDALAEILGREIILDARTTEIITERYHNRGRVMTPAAERQALILKGAVVLPNSVGAAPGQRIELPDDKFILILPGPPNEFNAILNEEIIPWLKEQFPEARAEIIRSIWTRGIFESDIATLLEDKKFNPAGADLGFYPANGQVEIRITASPDRENEATTVEKKLKELLSGYLIEQPEPQRN